jgi:hypothetical protein
MARERPDFNVGDIARSCRISFEGLKALPCRLHRKKKRGGLPKGALVAAWAARKVDKADTPSATALPLRPGRIPEADSLLPGHLGRAIYSEVELI